MRSSAAANTLTSGSRARLLLAVSALLVVAALAPSPALAQDGGSNACATDVRATSISRVADLVVDCGNEQIANVHINPSDQGTIHAEGGTLCEEVGNDEYDCQPTDGGSRISVRFHDDVGDVCADPRLTVTFDIELENGERETVDNQEVSGCDRRRHRSTHAREDHGRFPDGGVDSGGGGMAGSFGSSGGTTTHSTGSSVVPSMVLALVMLGATAAVFRRRGPR